MSKDKFKNRFIDYFKNKRPDGMKVYRDDPNFIVRQSELYFKVADCYIKPSEYDSFFVFIRETEQYYCDDYKFKQKCIEFSKRNDQPNTGTPPHLIPLEYKFSNQLDNYALASWTLRLRENGNPDFRIVDSVASTIQAIPKHREYFNGLLDSLRWSVFFAWIKKGDWIHPGLNEAEIDQLQSAYQKICDMRKVMI